VRTIHQYFGSADTLPTCVRTSSPGGQRRIAAEQFVHRVFKQYYQADVSHFMPTLMSLSDDQDQMQAVLGFRHADEEPLFLETYLDQPVEQLLARQINMPVDRSRLVEVGNLSVANAGGTRWLFTALTAYLSTTHCEWVLFTIGPVLQNAFKRLGFTLIDLAEARRDQLLPEEQAAWGSYYDQKPRVMAGRLADAHAGLWAMCEQEVAMMNLWQQAVEVGSQAA
jgi:hypothetical protein